MDENFDSIILDLILDSRKMDDLISTPSFEDSEWAERYKELMETVDDELRKKFGCIRRDLENYYELNLLNIYAKMLNIGMKIGIQYMQIDNFLNQE